MRPGVYDADFQVNGISQKGIAFVRSDIVRGFDDRLMYFIGSSVGSAPRRGFAVRYAPNECIGFRFRVLNDSPGSFTFAGETINPPRIEIVVQASWVQNLP
jgi:hypothetical protein